MTKTDETVGARFFMAPEQEKGRLEDVDIRVDIYALGKLLHYMLTGRFLHREELDEAFTEDERKADNRIHQIEEEILGKSIVLEPNSRFETVKKLKQAAEQILNESRGGPGMAAAAPAPVPSNSMSSAPQSQAEVAPRETESEVSPVKETFDAAVESMNSGNSVSLKLKLDQLTQEFRTSWKHMRPQIEGDPGRAPAAAKRMTGDITPQSGIVLAAARIDAIDMFDDFKRMLQSMLRASEHESGYVAIISVPWIPAGFLYMTACVGALHWNSWSLLDRLLNDKFEWYYQSSRPLFDFGFQMEYFFHAEAFGRSASTIHDFYRQVLSQPEYLQIFGIDADSLLTVYVQAQMMHCLRAAQEFEQGNERAIWPDFGRFNDYRVLQLLDRIWNDPNFADNFCRVFNEPPEDWKNNLNGRLALIHENWFISSNYIWGSVRSYEPR